MKLLITTVCLALAWPGAAWAENGGAQGYKTLKDIGSAVPGFNNWREPSPAKAAPGPTVPGCPSIAGIKPDWVEHTDPADIPARLKQHLASPLVQSGPVLLPIHRVPYYLGVSRRGGLLAQTDVEPGCQVTGTAAYYVIGEEGAPEIDFDRLIAALGGEKALTARLAELRWFNLEDGRRHRWYNLELAARRGWLVDEFGRPTPDYRPIETYTNAVNELY